MWQTAIAALAGVVQLALHQLGSHLVDQLAEGHALR
jgi:hypothetical protein